MAGNKKKTTKSTKKKAPVLPEAPLSIHIDAYYKGFHAGFTIRKSDNTKIPAGKVSTIIESLIAKDFKPSWNDDTNDNHGNGNGKKTKQTPEAASATPVCQVHNAEMEWKSGVSKSTNKPYAFWACPIKAPDGTFCKYKPPASS